MKKIKAIAILGALFFLIGCAGTIQDVSKLHTETMTALKDAAKESQHFWLFGSNIIQVNLEGIPDAEWIVDRLLRVDQFFLNEDGSIKEDIDLNDIQLGQMIGTQLRLSGPVLDAFIRFYAPQIIGNAGVVSLLAFLGSL